MGGTKRIAFMGSDVIALPALRFLDDQQDVELAGVFTQPDRPAGRGKRLRVNPIKEWATKRGIECLAPEKPDAAEAAWLQSKRISLVMVMAYGHLLKPDLIDSVGGRVYNLHASLLPSYRGASPIETAIAEGERSTGVSLMRIISKMDAGPLVDQQKTDLKDDEDGPSLREKLALLCPALLKRNLNHLLAGSAKEMTQDEAHATYCRILRKEDGNLDFSIPADTLARRVAAFKAWPGCFFAFGDVRIKVGAALALDDSTNCVPGEIIGERNGALCLATGEGTLAVLAMQRPGGKMLDAPSFLRGFPLPDGTRLPTISNTPLVGDHAGFFRKNKYVD